MGLPKWSSASDPRKEGPRGLAGAAAHGLRACTHVAEGSGAHVVWTHVNKLMFLFRPRGAQPAAAPPAAGRTLERHHARLSCQGWGGEEPDNKLTVLTALTSTIPSP